jgi:hypothetical protein
MPYFLIEIKFFISEQKRENGHFPKEIYFYFFFGRPGSQARRRAFRS